MLSAYRLPITLLSCVVSLLLVFPATRLQAADAEFPGLAETMTRAEFARAGLDKLSAEELAVLDAWIRQMTSTTAADADSSTDTTPEQQATTQERERQIAEAEAAARAAQIEAEAALAPRRPRRQKPRPRLKQRQPDRRPPKRRALRLLKRPHRRSRQHIRRLLPQPPAPGNSRPSPFRMAAG